MRKLLFLLFLPLWTIAQTVPPDATPLENIQITNNIQSTTATKTTVRENNGVQNWVNNEDLKIPFTPVNYSTPTQTIGNHFLGIDNRLGQISSTSAGLTQRVYFTADNTTVTAGTFFTSSITGKGTAATGSPSALVLADNTKGYFNKDVISIAQPSPTIGYAGSYSGNLTVSATPTPVATQQRFTIEIYRCNNGGTPIASGVSGAPTGDLGVTVVAILDSGVVNLVAGAFTNIPVIGILTQNITINTGERLRYHVSAAKIGTGGGNVTFGVYYGSSYNSYYDVPVAITTDAVLNKSAVTPAVTSSDALNLLNTNKANDNAVLHKTGDTFLNATDFDQLLSQEPGSLTVKKRDLQPEGTRLDPAFSPIYAWGDSLTGEYLAPPFPASYPTLLTTALGYTVTNKGVGGETSTQIKDRLVADTGNYNKSVIIWAGNNNFSDPTTVKADIATMVSTIGHTRYLIVSLFNNATNPLGSSNYNIIMALNNDLKTLYGNKYVSLREFIVSKYNPSIPQDVTDHANDVPPSSLRLDNIHLNTQGNTYVTEFLNQRLGVLYGQNGYLQSKDFKYYFESFSPAHTIGNETINGVKTFSSSPIFSSETASTIASFDATKNLKALSTATYPSLTELSYVKGVTSAIQTQLNSKQATLTNPITGTGTSGQVSYWNGTNTVTGNAALQWDNTNKRFGINVASTPQASIDVRAEGSEKVLSLYDYSNTLTIGATVLGSRFGGTKASPTAVLANMLLGGFQVAGYEGTAAGAITATINMFAKQDFTPSNQPTFIDIETTPVSSIVKATRLRIDSDGRALFGTTTNNGVDQVQVTGTASGTVDATLSNQFVRKGQLDAAVRPYKAYTVLITQTGTSAPTAIVLENGLTGTVTYSYSSTGTYLATLTGAFTIDKTWTMINTATNTSSYSATASRINSNDVQIITANASGTLANDVLLKAPFEIRVYN